MWTIKMVRLGLEEIIFLKQVQYTAENQIIVVHIFYMKICKGSK